MTATLKRPIALLVALVATLIMFDAVGGTGCDPKVVSHVQVSTP